MSKMTVADFITLLRQMPQDAEIVLEDDDGTGPPADLVLARFQVLEGYYTDEEIEGLKRDCGLTEDDITEVPPVVRISRYSDDDGD